MDPWAKGIAAITLFVEDLAAARQFYQHVFDLPVHFEDPHSAVFKFGDTLINLLSIEHASELIGPAAVAPREAGRTAPERPDGSAMGTSDRELRGPWRPHLGDRQLRGAAS